MSGISPYSGNFGKAELIHLLKRTMFGAKRSDIDFFASQTLTQVVDYLLNATPPALLPPIKDYAETGATTPDTTVLQGTTWVNDINNDGTIQSRRKGSYKKWLTGTYINQDRSIIEKMTLFWINHFGNEVDQINANWAYNQNVLLRTHCLGNFKTMIDLMTKDVGMLYYLNGYLNRKTAPDENYARELQELFTIGKELGTSGYNESDVQQAAKVLTGWRINFTTYQPYFTLSRHETANKTFSSYYGNTVISGNNTSNAGQIELDALLAMIFAQEEVAKHIVRKLYRYFVYYTINSTIETNVIIPLAQTFRNNNYEIKPVIRQLLLSEHFFDTVVSQGAVIKSPVDFYIAAMREWNVTFPASTDWNTNYRLFNQIHNVLIQGSLSLHDPPNVAGYPAYYQAPQFHEMWLNSTTYPLRKQVMDLMLSNGITQNGYNIKFDYLTFTQNLSNPSDPNILIDDVLLYFMRIPIDEAAQTTIKNQYLLSGQTSDYYWTDAWNNYINNPTNVTYLNIVKTRLQQFYVRILGLEEYQLS